MFCAWAYSPSSWHWIGAGFHSGQLVWSMYTSCSPTNAHVLFGFPREGFLLCHRGAKTSLGLLFCLVYLLVVLLLVVLLLLNSRHILAWDLSELQFPPRFILGSRAKAPLPLAYPSSCPICFPFGEFSPKCSCSEYTCLTVYFLFPYFLFSHNLSQSSPIPHPHPQVHLPHPEISLLLAFSKTLILLIGFGTFYVNKK